MTAYLTHRNIAFGLAIVIGLGAFAGSATELLRIAERANYGLPIGVVFALDGLAVVCVIVLSARKDWQALATLVAATLMSVGLQVLAVPRDQAWDRLASAIAVHALVPLASFVAVHLATRLDRPGATPPAAIKPRPRTRPAPPATAEPEVKPTPLRPAKPDARPLRPAAGTLSLVAIVEQAAGDMGRAPGDLSRAQVQELVKNHPTRAGVGIGTKRAGEILDHFRTRPPLELVEAER